MLCLCRYRIYFVRISSAFVALPLYFFLPKEKGRYLCLIMCLIWRFIVRKKSTMKYTRRMGQNTGTLNMLKNVMQNAIKKALQQEYQNLYSGKRRMNGLYSSEELTGRDGPSMSWSSMGDKKPINRLSRKIPSPYVTI